MEKQITQTRIRAVKPPESNGYVEIQTVEEIPRSVCTCYVTDIAEANAARIVELWNAALAADEFKIIARGTIDGVPVTVVDVPAASEVQS